MDGFVEQVETQQGRERREVERMEEQKEK